MHDETFLHCPFGRKHVVSCSGLRKFRRQQMRQGNLRDKRQHLVRLNWLDKGEWLPETVCDKPQIHVMLQGTCNFRSQAGISLIEGSYAALIPDRVCYDQQAGDKGALIAVIDLPDLLQTAAPSIPGRIEDSHSYFLISRLISDALTEKQGAHSNGIAEALCRHLSTGAWRSPGGNQDCLFEVASEVHNRRVSQPSMEELAELASLHPMSLARKFRQFRGCSIGEFRQRMRAERAFYLLIKTTLPLSQVGLTCGFADQSHMTRSLGRFLGITPARLRQAFGQPLASTSY